METLVADKQALQGTWEIDPAHSEMNFRVTHLVISRVTGNFKEYSGKIINEGADLTSAQFDFEIDVASLDTRNEMRDTHLKSDDFFNADEYPSIRFTSRRVEKENEDQYHITGDLSIRDITREVTFIATLGGIAVDGYGNTKLGLEVRTSLNRFDYKLKWNQITETGGAVVGKEVQVDAHLQFTKQ